MSVFKKKPRLEDMDDLSIAEQLKAEAEAQKEEAAAAEVERSEAKGLAKVMPTLAKNRGKKTKKDVPVKYVLPRIDILPMALILANKRRKVVRMFVLLGIGLVSIVGVIWFAQTSAVDLASQRLADTRAEVEGALASVNRLKPIGDYMNGLQERVSIAVDAANSQVDYAEVTEGIAAVAPPGVTVSEVFIEYQAPTGSAPPACGTENDPFAGADTTEPLFGCVTFNGTATSTQALNQFMRNVDTIPTLRYALIIPGAAAGEDGDIAVPFSGTAAITEQASVADEAMSIIDLTGLNGIIVEDPNAALAGPEDPADADIGAGANEVEEVQ